MASDSLNVDLSDIPRVLRGYDPQATEERFTRVAWEYSVLSGEHRKLKQSIENGPAPTPTQQPAPAPVQRLGDLDEVSRSLLTAAHKAAKEMRESVREECEAILKAARRRAAELEKDAGQAAVNSAAVLDSAREFRARLSEALAELERVDLPRGAETEPASEDRSTLDLVS